MNNKKNDQDNLGFLIMIVSSNLGVELLYVGWDIDYIGMVLTLRDYWTILYSGFLVSGFLVFHFWIGWVYKGGNVYNF
jgi:hypothetical protein